MDWLGELTPQGGTGPLSLVDEWLKVSLYLAPSPPCKLWWMCPIFSVSQSEEGFEKVYQGSAIMPVWDVELKASGFWEGSVELVLRSLA